MGTINNLTIFSENFATQHATLPMHHTVHIAMQTGITVHHTTQYQKGGNSRLAIFFPQYEEIFDSDCQKNNPNSPLINTYIAT